MNTTIPSFILASILFVAGLLHLFIPEIFLVAMPTYLPYHLELVYLTGFMELVLAAGLIFTHTRKKAGYLTALYFLAILPAHIHVSWNRVTMFGISSPLLLWGRTLFQGVFISWAYIIGKKAK